jgi:hypothetical protein
MPRNYQELRPSQFITTYGPGSVIETGTGPVVVKSMDTLFTAIGRQPHEFEVIDDRLSRLELDGARIARVPTNAELGLSSDSPIYPTDGFPFWGLCAQHRPHQVLYEAGTGCPECPAMPSWQRREKSGREAIRFVLACENGHLDDVHWHGLVHRGGRCGTRHYLWHGGGRALRLVRIACPRCGADANFGQAYARTWPCTGRLAEFGARPAPGSLRCTADAHIIQRGAANLHVGVLQSALTILNMPARLHNVLSDRALLAAAGVLHRRGLLDRDALLEEARQAGLSPDAIAYLRNIAWVDVRAALDELLDVQGAGRPSLKDEEVERLQHAATHGAPAVPHAHRGSPPMFEVRRADVRNVMGPTSRVTMRITPVSRLRMVMVQTGYQRFDPENAEVVPSFFDWNGVRWYPGIELFGEGVFLDFGADPPTLTGPRVDVWDARFAATGATELHPVHVWWHSLAHRLLWALSVDSGYSSASIRERVYLRLDNGIVARSGLLLYTVQPGGDGTLGGLIALVRRFENVLGRALQDVDTCSNDPLCEEAPSVGASGAACYSCLFASETSCEHRNHGLDRLLLRDNLP